MYLVCDAASGMQSALIDTIKASNVETVMMVLQFYFEPGYQQASSMRSMFGTMEMFGT